MSTPQLPNDPSAAGERSSGNVVSLPLVPAPWTRDDERTRREWEPLLSVAGPHNFTLDELERIAVASFPSSVRRRRLMNNLRHWISAWLPLLRSCEIFIDGSFLTSKPNPNDIDMYLSFERSAFHGLHSEQVNELTEQLLKRAQIKEAFGLDVYAHPADDLLTRNRFIASFSATSSGAAKGFARVVVTA